MATRRQDFFVQFRKAGLDQDSSVGKIGNNSSYHLLFSIFYFYLLYQLWDYVLKIYFFFSFCTGGSSTRILLWSPRHGHDDSGVEHLDSAPCNTDHSSLFATRNNVCRHP
jgi:hypothetical protein